MQPKVTFYSNELSQFLSGKECKKSSYHTKIATGDTFCIKHHFKFFVQLIHSNNMADDELNQKIWPAVTFEKKIMFYNSYCQKIHPQSHATIKQKTQL